MVSEVATLGNYTANGLVSAGLSKAPDGPDRSNSLHQFERLHVYGLNWSGVSLRCPLRKPGANRQVFGQAGLQCSMSD